MPTDDIIETLGHESGSLTDEYLRTNLWIDAVTSLEAAQDFCARVTVDKLRWKWVLMAVHSAVQGFMALALEHGNALLVMKDDVAAKWREAHATGAQYPDERMDFFLSLYDKVKTDVVACYVESKEFVPGASHDSSVKKLNELRNGFVHFMPKVWAIKVAGLPVICLDCLDLACFLAWESGTILWHDEDLSRRAQTALTVLRAELTAIDGIYNP
jgi:hypothetical protein